MWQEELRRESGYVSEMVLCMFKSHGLKPPISMCPQGSPSWNPETNVPWRSWDERPCGEREKTCYPRWASPKSTCQLTATTWVTPEKISRRTIQPIHRIMRNDKYLLFEATEFCGTLMWRRSNRGSCKSSVRKVTEKWVGVGKAKSRVRREFQTVNNRVLAQGGQLTASLTAEGRAPQEGIE